MLNGRPISSIPLVATLGIFAIAAVSAHRLPFFLLATHPSNWRRRCRLFALKQKALSDEEEWIAVSIGDTMPPAARLGIGVEKLDETDGTLSLSMPLEGNTNVHGSAFAGSLYSVAALCSWYTTTCYLRARGIADSYTVVIKSAEISYKRPATDQRIVARSALPSEEEREKFVDSLEEDGKATLNVKGKVLLENGKAAVEYTAVMCAFTPR